MTEQMNQRKEAKEFAKVLVASDKQRAIDLEKTEPIEYLLRKKDQQQRRELQEKNMQRYSEMVIPREQAKSKKIDDLFNRYVKQKE